MTEKNTIVETSQKSLANVEEPKPLVSNEKIINYYEEAILNLKEDRETADEKFKLMFEQMINGGDASSSSKELVGNLLKLKFETTDKMIKILDLWTRIHLKESNTMPDWAKAKQNVKNQQINIHASGKDLFEIVDNVTDKKD